MRPREAPSAAARRAPAPAGDPRNEQVRRVRARDQPHERDRGQRQPAIRTSPTTCVLRSIMPHVALSSWYEDFQIGKMRLLIAVSSAVAARSAPGAQPPEHRDEERTLARRRPIARRCRTAGPVRAVRSSAQHSDQRVVRAVEPHGPPDAHAGRPAAAARTVADDHRRGLPARPSAAVKSRPSAGGIPSRPK